MKTTLPVALVLLTTLFAGADDKAGKDKQPAAKAPALNVPGYRTRTVEGFTVLVSNTVLEQDVSKYERKPLEVLELELETVRRVMYPRAVKALQQGVFVFVEWEEELEDMPNAVAVYYGGSQLSMLKKGKTPLKAKNVEVLNLKRITRARQPGAKQAICFLLHEFTHAVHDQVLNGQNPLIKAAYQQAMDRKLYDEVEHVSGKKMKAYAASNDHEYFAELSCTYLDRGSYFPFTRDDLKKHDPTGYKLMEAVWGKPYEQVTAEREKTKADKEKPKPAPQPPVVGEKPKPPTAEDVEETAARRLKLVREVIADGKTERARERLNELIKEYPNTKAAAEAKQLLEKLK